MTNFKQTDPESLFSLAKAGDLDAYGEIVRRYRKMAVGYAYAVLGDLHLAEDASQEAFVEGFTVLRQLYAPSAFPGLLRRIIYKHCDRIIRKRREDPLQDADAVATTLRPDEALEVQEKQKMVTTAVEALPSRIQDAIRLFYLAEYSIREVAAFLEVPSSTVKKRLFDGRRILRERLAEMASDSDEVFATKVIDGVRASSGFSTIVYSLQAAFKAAGSEWSVPRLAATFGYPFHFCMADGAKYIMHDGNIEWWLFFDRVNDLGYQLDHFQAVLKGRHRGEPAPTEQELKELKEKSWEAVRVSIERGVPAIAWQPMTVQQKESGLGAFEWGLLVGYDEKDKNYIVRHPRCAEDYTIRFDAFGYSDPVNWYYVIVVKDEKPFDSMTHEIVSLRESVGFSEGTRYNPTNSSIDIHALGFDAYELWLKALRSGDFDTQAQAVHAWQLEHMRRLASEYLAEVNGLFDPDVEGHLAQGAERYAEEAKICKELAQICRRFREEGEISPEDSTEAAGLLESALKKDREAVGHVMEALRAIP